ncbi:hypothetical protein MLD38_032140 [Melastoma candidum]|uniref:Uncharacterized protein n=1 Tax=Melastoma candidum TaxID=119954 RepID=A0ACB9M4Q6_9MYRT|nr:hypothetical protein MLD38_032140 [Melastoma candidum]
MPYLITLMSIILTSKRYLPRVVRDDCCLEGILAADALEYDHTATVECLASPHKPQYNGGIIRNPELNHGLDSWSSFGNSKVEHRHAEGNGFIVARGRNQSYDSISQKVYLRKDLLYTFSAWVQLSDGEIPIRAVLKTRTGFRHIGVVEAKSGCWSMIKGGITADSSGVAQLYFESVSHTSVEIWIDSVSLQPFTKDQWASHQRQNIQKNHKRKVQISVVDKGNNPVANATVSIVQNRLGFPFGSAINTNILNNPAYKNWFTPRFGVTVFEDELKWYSNEPTIGQEDYSSADALLAFAKQNLIQVRGHNVLWDDAKYQPAWVGSLTTSQLSDAVWRRHNSVLTRYKGQMIGWDVVNENIHFTFLEDKLGPDASGKFYAAANAIDATATMFLNEYNTIENPNDPKVTPSSYVNKIIQIQAAGGHNLGIGLESHFKISPDIAYVRSGIDVLGATGLPIWITELDVLGGPSQAQYLEQVLREFHSHPKINGIVLWAAWKPGGCFRMCLTDNNFNNLETGNVVDKLLREWGGLAVTTTGTTDSEGIIEVELFHGDYKVSVDGGRNDSSPSYVGLHETKANEIGEKSHWSLIV